MTSNKKTIRYQQLVKKMRNKTGLSTEKNQKVVDTFIEMLTVAISDGNSVSISKLGTFSYRERKNVVTRNVSTGAVYQPIDTAFATFSSSPPFKEKIKSKIEGRDLVIDTVEENPEPTKAIQTKSIARPSKKKDTASTEKTSTTTKSKPSEKTSSATAKKATTTKRTSSTSSKKASTTKDDNSYSTKQTPTKRKLKRKPKSKLIVDE